MSGRTPIFYTFGNHHHWIDFEWLWGYKVTPDSIYDMLRYCRETGAKGNVNFDAVGYEKMAAECPEALATLRQAIQEGTIEPVGCSYGQPYGLFHGGESNIRQRIYGVRAVMRLLGYRPRTFWEEEFDFFPQLPQILKGCGFECASLYFQWTWHTPEVPKEDVPVVWWEAPDGSRLLTATRNRFNLHQWPEDFQILLDELAGNPPPPGAQREEEGAAGGGLETPPPPGAKREEEGAGGGGLRAQRAVREGDGPKAHTQSGHVPSAPEPLSPTPLSSGAGERGAIPLILQWLELIPSQDWMCRAELMIPMLKKLQEDPRFEVRMGTLGEYLKGIADCGLRIADSGHSESNPKSEIQNSQSDIPVRRYTMDQVWHGMSLGKNGDEIRRTSRRTEFLLQQAETLSAVLSLFGRPYAQWDVYPTWEVEEAWRELLQAQHHDNDECEALCGRMGWVSYRKALHLSKNVLDNQVDLPRKRSRGQLGKVAAFNSLGWQRDLVTKVKGHTLFSYRDIPAFGWRTKAISNESTLQHRSQKSPGGFVIETERASCKVTVDAPEVPSIDIDGRMTVRIDSIACRHDKRACRASKVRSSDVSRELVSVFLESPEWPTPDWASVAVFVDPGPVGEGIQFAVHCHPLEGEPDPGMNSGWQLPLSPRFPVHQLLADVPYGTYEVRSPLKGLKKYPSGDWMTSSQWFETVENGFTSSSFVDFVGADGSGVLVLHDGSQQWFLDEPGGARVLLGMMDPWDEDQATASCEASFCAIPHGPITNSDRHRLAREFVGWRDGVPTWDFDPSGADLPESFSPLRCTPSNVVPTAFYREEAYYAGRDLENYAGEGMGHPFVIRLVEFDGLESDVQLTLPGPIAKAFKTNLMGEIEVELMPEETDAERLGNLSPQSFSPPEQERRGFPLPPGAQREEEGVGEGGLRAQRAVPRSATPALQWQSLRFKIRPYEIATVYADLVPGRKQFRDLDAMRKVWATVHRVED